MMEGHSFFKRCYNKDQLSLDRVYPKNVCISEKAAAFFQLSL